MEESKGKTKNIICENFVSKVAIKGIFLGRDGKTRYC